MLPPTEGRCLLKRISDLSRQLTSLESKTYAVLDMNVSSNLLLFCRPVGYIRTAYATKNGTPRQGVVCPQVRAELRISRDIFSNPSHSLQGLKEFRYVWLIFWFHLNQVSSAKAKIRPPRMGGRSTGVFSTRSPHRPNPVGLTLAYLEEVSGDTLTLTGVDLVDGTPVLDVKPFIESYDSPSDLLHHPISYDTWVTRAEQSKQLHNVVLTAEARESLNSFHKRCSQEMCPRCLQFSDEDTLLPAIEELLKSDLRSVYRKSKCSDRIHFLTLDNVKLSVWYDSKGCAHVLQIDCFRDDVIERSKIVVKYM